MKRLLIITLFLTICLSCKKTPISPEGPTDVRIRNISESALTEVVVRIEDEEIGFGTIEKSAESAYKRFKTAFPKAYITATINGDAISTGPVDFTYMNYFGRVRMTYDVIVENRILTIKNVTIDSPL